MDGIQELRASPATLSFLLSLGPIKPMKPKGAMPATLLAVIVIAVLVALFLIAVGAAALPVIGQGGGGFTCDFYCFRKTMNLLEDKILPEACGC